MEVKRINDSISTTHLLTIHNHSGTHIDGPAHFYPDADSIDQFDINEFVFKSSRLIDVPKNPNELIQISDLQQHESAIDAADILFIRTGFNIYRNQPEYWSNQNPAFSSDVADYLRKNFPSLHALGMDLPAAVSPSHLKEGIDFHLKMLEVDSKGHHIWLIEDVNLTEYNKNIFRVLVIPLIVKTTDSAPCVILGEI
ncbi:MAG: cyclase family protein [Actinobacteria bacterium]|nr:cyclase family protein [Actinomycetota bacterium]